MSIIQFKNVSKRFLPANDGLMDISFSVDPGEFIFITGPSGAGKTTLLRLLTREYTPTEGSIVFDNEDIVTISKKQLPLHRRKIGVVYQDYRLVPELNIWENVALPLIINQTPQSTIEQRVTDLLTLVDMTSKALLFPRQISGGEAQRISIARALALAPQVVFADEPSGNLDSETTASIIHLLNKINSLGTTLFLATHDQQVLKMYPKTRIIKLKNGAVEQDTHDKKSESKKDTETKPDNESESEKKEAETVTKDKATSAGFLNKLFKHEKMKKASQTT
ncbi:MAG TPA: ATP-binding cassette domain-containing protein [Candidatus Woesebacteria bacterium]|nr:ATP-binding cassette domain-containing protein [Candidatus Woesebacteria bacterium]HNS65150.1 ATP-binding cassette domain-containing protein [Candidatus Woesebacteria bacterium]